MPPRASTRSRSRSYEACARAPYFHDNSAKTLEDVVRHHATFFEIVTAMDPPALILTEQDQADLVAFMNLL